MSIDIEGVTGTGHACVTGDCPHSNASECCEELTAEIQRMEDALQGYNLVKQQRDQLFNAIIALVNLLPDLLQCRD